MQARALGLAFLVYVTFGPGPAAAANLVANPGFDHDLSGWSWGGPIDVTWVESDEVGGVGAMRVTGLSPNHLVHVFSECIPLTGGAPVVWGLSFRGVGGTDDGRGGAAVRFFENDDCSGVFQVETADLESRFGRSTWGPTQGTAVVPPWAKSARLFPRIFSGPQPPDTVLLDNAFLVEDSTCFETATTLCLWKERFRVSTEWETPDGTEGTARVQPLTSDSGYFWFFKSTNVEVVTKLLNGCPLNDRFWVFAAGLTDVQVQLTVLDTATGETWQRSTSGDQAFAPIQDTDAFATCPP